MPSEPIWRPSHDRIESSNLRHFMRTVAPRSHADDYAALHAWSVGDPAAFWSAVWDFCDVVAERKGDIAAYDLDRMPGARWFPDARLNFAENLLRRRDDAAALIFRGEDHAARSLSFAELYAAVSRLRQQLEAWGVRAGDRVVGYLPNMPETVVAMLATTSLGAIWSSCSPDFGINGVVDRFGQIEPRVLFAADGYTWGGKPVDSLTRVAGILDALPSIERAVVVPYLSGAPPIGSLPRTESYDAFVGREAAGEIEFAQLPFDHPLYIMYSSGTTGLPKCMVHGAGGTLLQHLKELVLHTDLRETDRLFYYATCGWMMWNWLTSGLASQATLMLFDGSPFAPSKKVLFDYADEERFNIFGTSAKFIDAVKKTGWRPMDTHSLASVHTILSTGSTLVPESFDFVYDAIKSDVHLGSMSGGTDLCGCLVATNPFGSVWSGEIQAPGLGQDIKVYDDDGKPMASGKGELVNVNSFPSMPLKFWNDEGGSKYHNAYFARFANTWCQGDFAEWTEHGGMIIHGRSDATLNPGGVRIGTAEIYAQVEQIPEVIEGCAIGQDFDNDVRVVLFVRLAEGVILDDALQKKIRDKIKTGASPRHVPARIVAVADIPRTKSGKITELAVRDVVHGRTVKNVEALANPEALDLFRGLEELKN